MVLPAPGHDDRWIRRFHSAENDRPALLCFPHAGGSASYYFPLSEALRSEVEVLAVQYPGRQDRRRERPIDSVHVLADEILTAAAGYLDRPITFFGHSMGAAVAFELAVRMQQRLGRTPRHLFASARRAPSCHRDEWTHLRSDADLAKELTRLGGTNTRILDDPEVLAAFLPITRNDYKAIETYRYQPGPPLRCGITALVGDADPHATVDEAAAWSKHTEKDFTLNVFPGGHFYLEEHRATVLDLLAQSFAADPAAN